MVCSLLLVCDGLGSTNLSTGCAIAYRLHKVCNSSSGQLELATRNMKLLSGCEDWDRLPGTLPVSSELYLRVGLKSRVFREARTLFIYKRKLLTFRKGIHELFGNYKLTRTVPVNSPIF